MDRREMKAIAGGCVCEANYTECSSGVKPIRRLIQIQQVKTDMRSNNRRKEKMVATETKDQEVVAGENVRRRESEGNHSSCTSRKGPMAVGKVAWKRSETGKFKGMPPPPPLQIVMGKRIKEILRRF
ncbi:hypothetical protein RUM44_009483 [Polyplax serrata]|uniref:Uncharacterized protein n=1 Tax=Polyplax serrata TaxID=468196 RepID=A0ABR1ATE4_POLSC